MLPTLAPHVTSVNGRTYVCSPGSTITVPDFDYGILGANGWVTVAQVGTTAQRPTRPNTPQLFHDTTLGFVIVWEGAAWRNPNTGAAV